MSVPAGAARRARRRGVWIVLGVVVVAVLGATVWIGVRGWLAKGELEAAARAADAAQTAVLASDAAAAGAAADELAERAGRAADLTGDPVWRAAEAIGGVGENLRAVRVLAAELDAVATGAIRSLAELTRTVDLASLRPADGRIDLAPLIAARPAAQAANAALADASAQVDAISADGLLEPLRAARDELSTALARTSDGVAALDNALTLAPAMLGADGPRNYLVLFQNNAELRATGGIPGALALVHTDGGLIELVAQATTDDFIGAGLPALPVPAETAALYGDLAGRFIQDVTMTPDFTVGASLAKQMWELRFGGTVDGVIAVDPVALSYLLTATGPVALPGGGELTAENAVTTLLVDAYDTHRDAAALDDYFAVGAAAAFDQVASGQADPRALVEGLVRAGDEHRISLWSADPEEQEVLAGTTLAGLGAAQRLLGGETYGVYFNDATGGKMAPYLDVAIDVGARVERADGRADVAVRVTLANTAPADAETALPRNVTGFGIFGVGAGKISTNLAIYAPAGAFDGGVERDGEPATYATGVDGGHLVTMIRVWLEPGESSTSVFRFVSAEPGQDAPIVVHTPLMTSLEVGTL